MIFRQYAIFNMSILVLMLSQVDTNTRLDPDGIWMPKHRLCCAAYRMPGAFVACFRNLPDVYISLENVFLQRLQDPPTKNTPKSLQISVKNAPRISTISFWRSPSKRCEMKKKKHWVVLVAHSLTRNGLQISVASTRPEILQRTLSPRWIRASGQLSSVWWIQLLISWYWYTIY